MHVLSGRKNFFGFVILIAVVCGVLLLKLHHSTSPAAPDSKPQLSRATTNQDPPRSTRVTKRDRDNLAESEEEADSAEEKFPKEKIEEYLQRHRRNASSLLAALHVSNDTNYLHEAAKSYPNDPQVQLAVLSQDVFPEQRRKWIDAFKASSPSNSLADYLSAQDYFKNHQQEAGIRELAAASAKGQFADYAMENFLNSKDLVRSSGYSAVMANMAGMSAMSSDSLSEMIGFKQIANTIKELQSQYSSAGDTASIENLTQMGLLASSRLTSGDGGKFLINHLVGLSSETIVLQALDQNTPYDFLNGQTPAQRLEALKAERASVKELTASFNSIFPQLNGSEVASYSERMKIYGEAEAMRWLKQQHPVTPSTGN